MAPMVIAAIAGAAKNHMEKRKAERQQTGSNEAPSSLSSAIGDAAISAYANKKGAELANEAAGVKATNETAATSPTGTAESDRRLKEILGENAPVDAFAKINAYIFKYKPEAQEMYGDAKGVDDKAHVGVMAQELAENPVTSAAVEEDENGYLEIDTNKLCTALAAVCADLSRRVLALEEALAEKNGGEK